MTNNQLAKISIGQTCKEMSVFLCEKNESYGNSAFDPTRIFSKCDPIEQINVRIDDKLSRMMRGNDFGEDVEQDLLGYLILKRSFKNYIKLLEDQKNESSSAS